MDNSRENKNKTEIELILLEIWISIFSCENLKYHHFEKNQQLKEQK
jgi:hypothetical protein